MQIEVWPRKGLRTFDLRSWSPRSLGLKCGRGRRGDSTPVRLDVTAAFPNAAHDDQVDAWSQAACRFRTSSSGIVDYYREEAQLAVPAAQPVGGGPAGIPPLRDTPVDTIPGRGR